MIGPSFLVLASDNVKRQVGGPAQQHDVREAEEAAEGRQGLGSVSVRVLAEDLRHVHLRVDERRRSSVNEVSTERPWESSYMSRYILVDIC